MYWKVLKINETDDIITYAYDINGKDLTGLATINKNTMEYKILKYLEFEDPKYSFFGAYIRPRLNKLNFPSEYEYKAG